LIFLEFQGLFLALRKVKLREVVGGI